MKRDAYNSTARWEYFKQAHFNKVPKGIKKENWILLIEFLKDMELGLNTPVGMKGKRDSGTLLNLSSHNKFFLERFKKPLMQLTKLDLHNLEKDISEGRILKRNGQPFTAFGNYIKDFKVFWNWGLRTGKFKINVAQDITSKIQKANWVYLDEEQIKTFFNQLDFDYRVYCWFLYDSGMRVTEFNSIKINNFNNDFTQVTIPDEAAKTFGRTINLKLSSQLIKEFVNNKKLQNEDFLFQKKPFSMNKYLKYHCKKIFGDKISHPKAKGNYKDFTIYDIRHCSSCYWLNRYPTHKGLMYRFGWRQADKIEYYSDFLGQADELKDSDMVIGEDKGKLYQLEKDIKDSNETIKKLQDGLNAHSELMQLLIQQIAAKQKTTVEKLLDSVLPLPATVYR